MQHHGNDLENTRSGSARNNNIGTFAGNKPGTKLPFATFKENFRRKALDEGSETGRKILFGEYEDMTLALPLWCDRQALVYGCFC